MTIRAFAVVLLCALLALPSHAGTVNIDGQVWTEHIDATDVPEECAALMPWRGCTTPSVRRIDYRSPVAQWVIEHEHGHAGGMQHGYFERSFGGLCAPVFSAGGKYHAGDTICISGNGEYVFPATALVEMK